MLADTRLLSHPLSPRCQTLVNHLQTSIEHSLPPPSCCMMTNIALCAYEPRCVGWTNRNKDSVKKKWRVDCGQREITLRLPLKKFKNISLYLFFSLYFFPLTNFILFVSHDLITPRAVTQAVHSPPSLVVRQCR